MAKLEIGVPSDPLEAEADQMADQVTSSSADSNRGDARGDASAKPPASIRSAFERRFGVDLSDVRVRTDGGATVAARTLGARAFTVGNEISFAAGRYAPTTNAGRRLIAHEVAHVVQQRQGRGRNTVLRNAEAYVWYPHVDGYGHAAFKLCDGTYISWWPAGGGDKKQQYWTGRPGGGHTYADDLDPAKGEGKGPDETYDLGCDCLDEAAIKTWYATEFTGSPDPKWSVLRNSCSDVAHRALNVGSALTNPCYASWSHSNYFWTPKDFGAYAACQARWCKSKAAGVGSAAGRYVWENTKEILGGAIVNDLRSLWWKGEIILH
jgi:hypothetical protein